MREIKKEMKDREIYIYVKPKCHWDIKKVKKPDKLKTLNIPNMFVPRPFWPNNCPTLWFLNQRCNLNMLQGNAMIKIKIRIIYRIAFASGTNIF